MSGTVHEWRESIRAAGDIRDRPLGVLALHQRTYNCLSTTGNIDTVGELLRHSEQELLRLPGFGKLSLRQLVKELAAWGLTLDDRTS